MDNRVSPLRPADLPNREKTLWEMTGPGAIMVGLAVGSGELILWPWIVARFGVTMAWAPIVATFFQVWITMEIGRWAIATGESAMRGMARWSRAVIYLYMGGMFVLAFLPAWGRALAATVRFMFFGLDGPGPEGSFLNSDWFWSIPLTLLVWVVLLGPNKIYDGLEKVVTLLVLVTFVGVIVVAVKIGSFQDLKELTYGVVGMNSSITLAEDFTFLKFFGATVFAGAGGFGLLYYSYYLRDKGIGMGQKFPMLSVDVRGKTERSSETGYIFAESPENRRRFREWNQFVILDTTLFFGVISIVTLFLFMFAALVALYPKNVGFAEGASLVWELSDILGAAMGAWGRYLFLFVAIAALLSTILAIADGSIRLWTDCIHTGFPATEKWTAGTMYVPLLVITSIINHVSMWYFETQAGLLDLFFISAAINGIAMAIFSPVVLLLNLKYLPRFARPGFWNILFVGLGTLMYAGFSIYLILIWIGVISDVG